MSITPVDVYMLLYDETYTHIASVAELIFENIKHLLAEQRNLENLLDFQGFFVLIFSLSATNIFSR